MPCLANLNGVPVLLFGPTTPPTPLEGTALIPVGASCVTFTFQLCANELAAMNQVAIEIFWSSANGVPLSQEVVLQQTAVCGVFSTCLAVFNSPEVAPADCIVWDLSLPIPAGKSDVQVVAEEIGDPANPGTLTVWVAFK
jgi:hypothetical protein